MLSEELTDALREAIKRSGSQASLSQEAGISQGGISAYLSGKADWRNVTIGTLERLFPEMEIKFFPDSAPIKNSVLITGRSTVNGGTLIGKSGPVNHYGPGSDPMIAEDMRRRAISAVIKLDGDPSTKDAVLKILDGL